MVDTPIYMPPPPQQGTIVSFPPYPLQHLLFVVLGFFPLIAHSERYEVVRHCSFDVHFSNNYWCWASFHVPVSYLLSLLWKKYLLRSSAYFLIEFIYIYWVVWAIYVFWIERYSFYLKYKPFYNLALRTIRGQRKDNLKPDSLQYSPTWDSWSGH